MDSGSGDTVIVRDPVSAVLVSAVSQEDAASVRCSEHPDARILEERPPSGAGDTYLYCPWHSARGLVIGGRGYLARYEFKKGAGHGIAVPDVIEGTVAPEDIVRANMRAAGFPVGSAADTRAIRAEAEQWAQDFAAAGRAEDAIVINLPGEEAAAAEQENW